MFDFLHKKPRPIFSVLGTDVHSHLLPAVDDGSQCLEDTIHCLNIMREVGFEKAVITPHYQYPRFPNVESDIEVRYAALNNALQAHPDYNGPQLIGVAGEYRVDSGFGVRIGQQNFLRIAGRYILIELSLHQQVMGLVEMVFDLQMKGYEIILAHPERYPYLSVESQLLERLKDMGVMFQTNILSLAGFYGESSRYKAYSLIDEGWVELLGTDMHNPIYAKALADATHDRRIEKLLETHQFFNSKIDSNEKIKTFKL